MSARDASAASPEAWADSAARLARRVRARARAGAVLRPTAVGLAVGAVCAVLARALLGADESLSRGVLLAGAALGAGAGALAARRVRAPSVADAAWAIDRLAGARERALTAALVPGEAGREACDALGEARPPRVRLRPPSGLVGFASAGLLAAIAWTASDVLPAPDPDGEDVGAPRGPSLGSAPTAEAREADAAALANRARSVAAAREALGLPAGASLDPERVAERLGSREAIESVRRAVAAEGVAVPGLEDPSALDALARMLAEDPSARVEALHREALALRAASAPPRVPLDRRDTVARYLARRDAAPEGGR
jgi:hypothetical protein